MQLKILAVGDVVGPDAHAALCKKLWGIRRDLGADMAVVNAENAAIGNGLEAAQAQTLFASGADVITSGNHIWHKKEIRDYLNTHRNILRPANYPPECPGSGYTIIDINNYKLLVINVMGTVFMDPLDDPFRTVAHILEREAGHYSFAMMDIHAEATSEKMALARYFDGRIAAIWGTHTHCPTADARVLPGGTGFITDLGMTGPDNSVLGIKNEIIIEKMTKKMPVRFEVASGPVSLEGALFTVDTDQNRCLEVHGVTGIKLN